MVMYLIANMFMGIQSGTSTCSTPLEEMFLKMSIYSTVAKQRAHYKNKTRINILHTYISSGKAEL